MAGISWNNRGSDFSWKKKRLREHPSRWVCRGIVPRENFWGGAVRDEREGFFEGFCRGFRESRADSLSSGSPWLPSSPARRNPDREPRCDEEPLAGERGRMEQRWGWGCWDLLGFRVVLAGGAPPGRKGKDTSDCSSGFAAGACSPGKGIVFQHSRSFCGRRGIFVVLTKEPSNERCWARCLCVGSVDPRWKSAAPALCS